MRYKIYRAIYKGDRRSIGYLYNVFIGFIAVLSIMPLMFKREFVSFNLIEHSAVTILAIDYILRFTLSDYILHKGFKSFLLYPFTFTALIDIISIVPSIKIFRVFRLFKIIVYMDFFLYIVQIYKRVKYIMFNVLTIVFSYIFVTALFMFNAEKDSFNNFFEALYWAVTALTTVGYGDIYPVTVQGRIVSMVSSVLGIALVALPSGIITASVIYELNKNIEK